MLQVVYETAGSGEPSAEVKPGALVARLARSRVTVIKHRQIAAHPAPRCQVYAGDPQVHYISLQLAWARCPRNGYLGPTAAKMFSYELPRSRPTNATTTARMWAACPLRGNHVRVGSLALVRALDAGANATAVDDMGDTILHRLCRPWSSLEGRSQPAVSCSRAPSRA